MIARLMEPIVPSFSYVLYVKNLNYASVNNQEKFQKSNFLTKKWAPVEPIGGGRIVKLFLVLPYQDKSLKS